MSWAARPRAIRILSNKNLNHATAEVVARGCEHGIDSVATCVGEVIAAHAVVFLEVADDNAV